MIFYTEGQSLGNIALEQGIKGGVAQGKMGVLLWESGAQVKTGNEGKIGAGQMGVEQVTVQNLDVVQVDPELNMIVIRGAIPGPKGGLVYIKNTVKNNKVKVGATDISRNPQKASGRNPQKASARNA